MRDWNTTSIQWLMLKQLPRFHLNIDGIIYSDLHQQKFQSNRIFFIIMTDLFNHHEQQFGNLSAEITARICKIPNLHGCKFRSCSDLIKFTLSLDQIAGEWNSLPQFNFPKSIVRWFFLAAKKSAVTDVERCFDEARELVSNFEILLSNLWQLD